VKDTVLTEPTLETVNTAVPAPAAPPGAPPTVEVVPLAEVLRQIRVDSRREPRRYLDETTVPFGGD
jgi:hypothetical protein